MIPNKNVLLDVKQNIGVADSNTVFDEIIITGISGGIATLNQLDCMLCQTLITPSATWDKLVNSKYESIFPLIKQFIILHTKLIFDPPTSSVLTQTIKSEISQLEWRINNHVSIVRG